MTEAMTAVITFAKKTLNLTEIVGRYAKENPASGHVLEKLHFQYEKDILYPCNGRNHYTPRRSMPSGNRLTAPPLIRMN